MTEPVVIIKADPAWRGSNTNAYGFIRHSGMDVMDDMLPVYRQDWWTEAKDYCASRTPVILHTRIARDSQKPYLSGMEKA